MGGTVVLRKAGGADRAALLEIWRDAMRRADEAALGADIDALLDEAAADDDSEVLVAEAEGRVVGAVCLRVALISPINRERVAQAISPHVLEGFTGRGVGRRLIEGAVQFAEERGIGFVGSAAMLGMRDANRFLARLGLAPEATLRLAPTHVVRAKVAAQRPGGSRGASPRLAQVLAARRSVRRRVETG